MRRALTARFTTERRAATARVALAAFTLAWITRAWFLSDPWLLAELPAGAFAVVYGAQGCVALVRARKKRDELRVLLATDPAGFLHEETARAVKRRQSMRARKLLGLALIAAALGVLVAWREHPLWLALGSSVALFALAMLILDIIEDASARKYAAELARFLDPRAPSVGDVETAE